MWLNTWRLAGLTHPRWDGKAALTSDGAARECGSLLLDHPSFQGPLTLRQPLFLQAGAPTGPKPALFLERTGRCSLQYGLLTASVDATLASTPSPTRRPLHPCPCCTSGFWPLQNSCNPNPMCPVLRTVSPLVHFSFNPP